MSVEDPSTRFEDTQDLRRRIADDAAHADLPLGSRLARSTLLRTLREVEQRDATTASHTWRVVLYMRSLCEAAGVEHSLIERLCEGAALHDIGKIDVPIEVLQKPGKLTEHEYALMKEHPVFGHARLVADGVDDQAIIEIVRHHHERVDGRGYPDGLVGDEIPMAARYFAVIDAFDALTSIRPYRPVVGPEAVERARDIIQRDVGTHFSEEAAFHLIDQSRRGNLDWIAEFFGRPEDELRASGVLKASSSIDELADRARFAHRQTAG